MKKSYYLFNPGRISRKDNTLRFDPKDEEGNEKKPKFIPIEGVEDLFVFGSLDGNSELFNFLGQNQVAVHYFDYYENYTGSFMPREYLHSGKMLLDQCQFHSKPKKRKELAARFVDGATHNMLRNLRYYQNRGKEMGKIVPEIEALREQIPQTQDIEALMGIEGNIRDRYYEGFDRILEPMKMGERTRQPPTNEVNALVSFGNMMCYTLCVKIIHRTQLHPTISFLHSPGERRFSLALDLAEIFKPILVDRVIFKVVNKKEVRPEHFDSKAKGIMMKEGGKKAFVKAFEDRCQETIQHRKLKRKVSYKHLVKLECYKLTKQFLGMDTYQPFKAWW